jgi:periplasmic protein TonB
VEPKISKTARTANLLAIVSVNCYIEPDGTTSNVHAIQTLLDKSAGSINEPVAKELEDAAVDAVKHYKFKPSKKDGKPVRVELNVDVHFGA